MSYYSRFEGDHLDQVDQIQQRRELLIELCKVHEPTNLAELLAASDDGEVDHELEWVQVPDPRNNAMIITVRPVLGYVKDNLADPEEKDRYDDGLSSILLEGRLPTGDERVIGMMSVFYHLGLTKFEPSLSINMSAENGIGGNVSWESADAEFWLRTVQAAIDAQPKQ